MKRVMVVAPTGMLGNAVVKELQKKYKLVLVFRNQKHLKLLEKVMPLSNHSTIQFDLEKLYQDFESGFNEHASPYLSHLIDKVGNVDAVINCAGIIKPHSLQNPKITLFVNGVFPHVLSRIYKEKLIQITTDCVFSGIKDAPYYENSPHSYNDLYGLSKSLGEPGDRSLVIRTSIIGRELHGKYSLVEWLISQKGEANGYTNHFWNGITTMQFGKICDTIISDRKAFPQKGIYHMFSNDVTKYELLNLLKERYKLKIKINPVEANSMIDRRLSSKKNLIQLLNIPSLESMIKSM